MTKRELRAISTGALELAIFYREKSLAIDIHEDYDSWKFYCELANEYDSIYLKYQDVLDELNKKDEFFNA